MGKMLSVEVDERYAKNIDAMIKKTGMYSSRSEFLKDSIRRNLEKMIESDEKLKDIHEGLKEIARVAKERGWDGKLPTRAERDKWAREFVKKNGIKIT